MKKLNKALVIAAKRAAALELTSGAAGLAEEVVVISLRGAECAVNASRAYCLDTADSSAVVALPAIMSLAAQEKPELVIAEEGRDGRLIAAAIAARAGSSALVGSLGLWLEDGRVCSKRMVYGGKSYKTEYALGETAVACVGYGVFAADGEVQAAESIDVGLTSPDRVEFISRVERRVQRIDLGSAKKVVGVGRGVGDAPKLQRAEAFASLIGAEMACTRPVAEEEKLMPKERYVGVTGSTIKPELYVALGISGEIQHMAGVNSSGTIIAVNKDENAPIFKQCDYGIVGDLLDVIDKLSEQLV